MLPLARGFLGQGILLGLLCAYLSSNLIRIENFRTPHENVPETERSGFMFMMFHSSRLQSKHNFTAG